MKTVFYFMNVDINWIKQRPHFIAENLMEKNAVTVFYPYFYNRKVLSKNNLKEKVISQRIFRVPNAIDCNWLKKKSDNITGRIIRRKINLIKPDVLFMCSPDQLNYIPDQYKGLVIYDCMDDLVALARTENEKERVYSKESEIISKSDCILVTSSELQNVICERYKDIINNKKIELCRNAFNGRIIATTETKNATSKLYRIGYFGTVSTWFDFKSLEYCLPKLSNVEFHLAGPVVDGVIIPEDSRIKYYGILKHEELIRFVEDTDCLMMPFEVNDIIKSVDPVKFYEYINFNKNIISVYYDEIKRFSPFVNFYNNKEELCSIIENLSIKNELKYTSEDRISFLEHNSWDCRCEQINQIIEDFYE